MDAGATQPSREQTRREREAHRRALEAEAQRLADEAAALGARQVFLFGSLARGEAGRFSDLDLLIVWESALPFVERCAEIYRLLKPRVAADILVYTPEEMETMRDRPMVRQALREGKVLYEA
jgi:uncharacterized protein